MIERSRPDTSSDVDRSTRAIGDDLLQGAEEIARYLYGDPTERRKVYHLAEASRIPVFRLGATLCARKSTLLAWIERQESRASNGFHAADSNPVDGTGRKGDE